MAKVVFNLTEEKVYIFFWKVPKKKLEAEIWRFMAIAVRTKNKVIIAGIHSCEGEGGENDIIFVSCLMWPAFIGISIHICFFLSLLYELNYNKITKIFYRIRSIQPHSFISFHKFQYLICLVVMFYMINIHSK